MYQISRWEPVRSLAQGYYDLISRISAARLMAKGDLGEIRLVKGAVDRCVPVVSDLDYLALSPTITADSLRALQAIYRRLRGSFWILGGVQLTTVSDWDLFVRSSPGPLLYYLSQKRYVRGRWLAETLVPSPAVGPGSRFALCLLHYLRAHDYLRQSPGTPLPRAQFRREIFKSAHFGDGNPLRILESEQTAASLSRAFQSLHHLAGAVLASRRPARVPSELPEPKGDGDPGHKRALLSTLALAELRTLLGEAFPLSPTPTPFFYLWEGDCDRETTVRLFSALFSAQSESRALRRFPLVCLTRPMYEAYLRGWSWERPLGHMAAARAYSLDEELVKADTLRCLRERALTGLNTLLIPVLSGKRGELRSALGTLCQEAAILAAEKSRDQIPETMVMARQLRECPGLDVTALPLDVLLGIREEVSALLRVR